MGGKGSGGLHVPKAKMREISMCCQTSSIAVDPTVNAASIEHNVELMRMGLEPLDWKDPQAVGDRTYRYLMQCAQDGRRPLVEGYALALGIDVSVLNKWLAGTARNPQASPESLEVIRRYYGVLKSMYAENLTSEEKNPAKWIFYGKNNFGYSDEKRQVVVADGTAATAPEEEVAARYAEVVGVVDA